MAEDFSCLDYDFVFDFDTESPLPEDLSRSSPDSVDSWIGEIENQLMNDDEIHEQQSNLDLDQQSVSDFIADLFVDYPVNDSVTVDLVTGEVSDLVTVVEKGTEQETEGSDDSGKKKKLDASNGSGNDSPDGDKLESEIEGNDDVVDKKRTRQIRNRDAAVRSRERKKEYVQDLERKSKYLERECMRLGRMLDCFVAENHSLRLYIQKGSGDTSMTKQESAVLLLESLLLGSLLWYLGDIICQFPLPRDTNSCVPVVTREPEKLVLSVQGKSSELSNKTGKYRRCKGFRPRMKHQLLTLVS